MRKVKSWKKLAPKLVSERHAVAKRCGVERAFLLPKTMGFPIIAKRGPCKPSCDGLRAAFARARQTHRREIAAKALRIACRQRCPWTARAERC
jgi:hypothetical protein